MSIFKFELDLSFMMLYISIQFERKCLIASKVIDWKQQIDNSKKGAIAQQNFADYTPFFELDLFSMMLDPSVKCKCN